MINLLFPDCVCAKVTLVKISKRAFFRIRLFNSYKAWEQQTASKQSSVNDKFAASPLIKMIKPSALFHISPAQRQLLESTAVNNRITLIAE